MRSTRRSRDRLLKHPRPKSALKNSAPDVAHAFLCAVSPFLATSSRLDTRVRADVETNVAPPPAADFAAYHDSVPGPPLNGPTMSGVAQPP